MPKLTALTTFLNNNDGMWSQGQVREVSEHHAQELLKRGFVALVPEPAVPRPEKTETKTPKKRVRKALNPVEETK